ncbi:MAG TPA: glycerophosphodiester phosphodiesterase family protein [Dokdonella sp.]|uniref:glycerophosphodiester phosphodiesterase family protein n=1 Tax=Dokdonella sp. TaxID=2291710 RepID=UPI002D7F4C5D|nr:glycerophosphodiester phosphodiesterase family protein [Dokdonella sp.]HET9032264.1 glycerophosphodiester phosphodiesterase family protein [Dokdonella sp.]
MSRQDKPLVIAHRGASALLPEHTLAAYARAIEDGADFIEPDLVLTRDGVLVARHEIELSRSTDVSTHAEFASRRTRKRIDGETISGWFCNDFSLAEFRSLRAREPLPHLRSSAHDGRYAVPTIDEIVELAQAESDRRGRLIGIIPEIKNSTWFHLHGMDPEQAIVAALNRHAYLRRAPFGIQSFEVGNLKVLRKATQSHANVFLVQLIGDDGQWPIDMQPAHDPASSYAAMITPTGLQDIAGYADVIATQLRRIVPIDESSGLPGKPNRLVADAHAVGLQVQAWTLRPENHFLPRGLRCSENPAQRCESGCMEEMRGLIDAGVDGLFTDDPALARRLVENHCR